MLNQHHQQNQAGIQGKYQGEAEIKGEVDREMERLAAATNDVRLLQAELASRLVKYSIPEPPSKEPAVTSVDAPIGSGFGLDIRELAVSLETTAGLIRLQIRTLAL